MARNLERNFAERIFDRVLAGGNCSAIFAASLGMAGDVLGWSAAGAAGAVYKDEGSGVGGVEAGPSREHRRGSADRRARVGAVRLSGRADDVHDVFIARDAGSLSGLFAGSAQGVGGGACEYRDAVQRRRGARRNRVWAFLAKDGTTQRNGGGAGT